MRIILFLVGLIFSFLFSSSIIYASALNGDIFIGGTGEGSLGKVTIVTTVDSSKEIKKVRTTSKDENIQKSKDKRISEEERRRINKIIENHDPGCPNYHGTPLR